MMPPKPKLNKSKGKRNLPISKTSTNEVPSNNDPSEQNNMNNVELQEQFEVELCWCIQQMQKALNTGKLNQQQVKEQTKLLNTLMSNSTSFIKKRQVMRLTFGDYRTKMAEESKKVGKGVSLKISTHSPSKSSKFVKKSLFSGASDSKFKFDFPVESTENVLLNELSKVEITSEDSPKPFHFTASSNTFRFNFSVETN